MNREILFRGKRVDNGKWIIGCLLIDYVTGQYYIHANGNSVNESDKVDEEGYLKFVAFEVNPETVCQYTGMVDKAGNEIYEGDILLNHYDDIYPENETLSVVFWDVNKWKIKEKGSTTDIDDTDEFEPCDAENAEIVGNIFDNTESGVGK